MKYRVHCSPAYHGAWVVQGWFTASQVWADVGDPHPNRRAAEDAMDARIRADRAEIRDAEHDVETTLARP